MTASTSAPIYMFCVMTVMRGAAVAGAAVDAATTRPSDAGPVTLESEQPTAKTRDSNSGTRAFMAAAGGGAAEHSPACGVRKTHVREGTPPGVGAPGTRTRRADTPLPPRPRRPTRARPEPDRHPPAPRWRGRHR